MGGCKENRRKTRILPFPLPRYEGRYLSKTQKVSHPIPSILTPPESLDLGFLKPLFQNLS